MTDNTANQGRDMQPPQTKAAPPAAATTRTDTITAPQPPTPAQLTAGRLRAQAQHVEAARIAARTASTSLDPYTLREAAQTIDNLDNAARSTAEALADASRGLAEQLARANAAEAELAVLRAKHPKPRPRPNPVLDVAVNAAAVPSYAAEYAKARYVTDLTGWHQHPADVLRTAHAINQRNPAAIIGTALSACDVRTDGPDTDRFPARLVTGMPETFLLPTPFYPDDPGRRTADLDNQHALLMMSELIADAYANRHMRGLYLDNVSDEAQGGPFAFARFAHLLENVAARIRVYNPEAVLGINCTIPLGRYSLDQIEALESLASPHPLLTLTLEIGFHPDDTSPQGIDEAHADALDFQRAGLDIVFIGIPTTRPDLAPVQAMQSERYFYAGLALLWRDYAARGALYVAPTVQPPTREPWQAWADQLGLPTSQATPADDLSATRTFERGTVTVDFVSRSASVTFT